MSMSDKDGEIWMDGKWMPWRDANVHILTHSLHYGMGAFEGVRAYETPNGPAVFRLKEHTERFLRSAHILDMPLDYSADELMKVQCEAITRNNLKSGYIRPLCFYGSEGMGLRADNLKTHVAVAAWHWGSYLGKDGMEKGIRVKTTSFTRHHVNVSMCRAKATGHYINSILALKEAMRDGYDEALFLDVHGYVAEGSGENIFVVKDNKIYTPMLTSCLEGITRDAIIKVARTLNYEVIEALITRDDIYGCDECFFTGTAAEVTPIRELDGRKLGSGVMGPITNQIQEKFFDAVVGKIPEFSDWLTPVAQ